MTVPKWTYKSNYITDISDVPEGAIGFVYLITTESNKKYIGKKNLYTIRKRWFGKKEKALITDKRVKLYEMVKKESKWQSYTGSEKLLNEDIKNGIEFKKEILHFAFNKKQLSYLETKELFCCGVLESEDDFYNSNINGTYYRKDTLSSNE